MINVTALDLSDIGSGQGSPRQLVPHCSVLRGLHKNNLSGLLGPGCCPCTMAFPFSSLPPCLSTRHSCSASKTHPLPSRPNHPHHCRSPPWQLGFGVGGGEAGDSFNPTHHHHQIQVAGFTRDRCLSVFFCGCVTGEQMYHGKLLF